jgi:hypothetical protein
MHPDAQPRILEIPAGGEVRFPGDYDSEGTKWIIQQLERSGGIPFNDLNAIKRPHTLIYRVHDIIESDTISEALELDMNARTDIAAEQMESAGFAAFNAAQTALRMSGRDPETLKETTLTIEEVTDGATVENGVNMEVTASTKPGTPTKLTRTEPRRRRRG